MKTREDVFGEGFFSAEDVAPFPVVRRGYSPDAVHDRVRTLEGRVRELQADLTEAREILESTRRAAADAWRDGYAKAKEQAQSGFALRLAELLRHAEEMAESIRRQAEQDAERMRAGAAEESERLRADAVGEAERLRREIADERDRVLGTVTADRDAVLREVAVIRAHLRSAFDELEALDGEQADRFEAGGTEDFVLRLPELPLEGDDLPPAADDVAIGGEAAAGPVQTGPSSGETAD